MPSIAPSKSSTNTRIASIPYLNSAPFFRGLALGDGLELTDATPRQMGERAAAGELLAGLLPVADYLRLEQVFERIGHFGIAVRGRVGSVMVFATRPLRQLEGAAIAVTSHTSTSGLLLRLVLEQHYRLQPLGYTPYDQPEAAAAAGADALLLIGDDALRFRQATTRYPYEADLAFEWWLWQHLPFVFAVWAVRRDATAQRKKQLEAALGRALTANSGQLDAIAQERARPLGLPPEDLCAYLEAFHYRLGPAEEAGIEKFRELAKGHGLL